MTKPTERDRDDLVAGWERNGFPQMASAGMALAAKIRSGE